MIISVSAACEKLKNDDVVALPTETVYGLAGSIESEKALHKIFKTKSRPFFDPLIVHVCSIEQAKEIVSEWPKIYDVLVKSFWPGPLTVIVNKNDRVSSLISSGLETVAIRVPTGPMLEIIKKVGPLAAPSANKFKKTSPTNSSHVLDEFNSQVSVVEGGPSQIGIESTIITFKDNELHILRPGIVTAQTIKESLKGSLFENCPVLYKESTIAPGQLEEHYRPKLELTTYINQSIDHLSYDNLTYVWKINHDESALVARELYQKLRKADKDLYKRMVISLNFEPDDLWTGIIDRLKKASFHFNRI